MRLASGIGWCRGASEARPITLPGTPLYGARSRLSIHGLPISIEALALGARSTCRPWRSRWTAGLRRNKRSFEVAASDVDLLCDFNGVINLDTEIPDRALDLGMSEQKLHCTQISGLAIDEGLNRPGFAGGSNS